MSGSSKRSGSYGSVGSSDASTVLAEVGLSAAMLAALKGAQALRYRSKRKKEHATAAKVTGPNDLSKKSPTDTNPDNDRKNTNPKFGQEGYTQNCMYCTTAYDLRRRGYDVQANYRLEGGKPKEITTWYKDSKLEKYRKPSEALEHLKQQPEGARGNLCGSGKFGGHSVAYEIHNGKVKIIDGQANENYTWDYFTSMFSGPMYFVRTDNCEPNWENIGETISPDNLKKR